jgi:hypothetical protein
MSEEILNITSRGKWRLSNRSALSDPGAYEGEGQSLALPGGPWAVSLGSWSFPT